jgi:hypothetical protein
MLMGGVIIQWMTIISKRGDAPFMEMTGRMTHGWHTA